MKASLVQQTHFVTKLIHYWASVEDILVIGNPLTGQPKMVLRNDDAVFLSKRHQIIIKAKCREKDESDDKS